jgi:Protein of unknown function (DUF1592)/Protein of unknown function (DUF1588)/Protein of unknown function (DUF1587)/Protein of unknown function (DUF1585)/Protein of unknown function (DUF1595)/Planctomycete cytochrome C
MKSGGCKVRNELRSPTFVLGSWLLVGSMGAWCVADEIPAAASFRERAQPILETYCYGCHGYGASEGGRTLDEFESDEALVADRELWWAVLKNVRAGVMPPAGEERPTKEEQRVLFDWIKFEAFGIDPANPDPGHVTLRRLNRVEYRNTIRDLMGVEFDTADEFPTDDTGYGFDNIGDVLSISPLLLEKYLHAAEAIVAEAVPTDAAEGDEREQQKYARFFPRAKVPDEAQARDEYARQILSRFARRAYRRPAEDSTIERLTALAQETYALPGQTFEAGIRRAMVAVLASPRFLFRLETVEAEGHDQTHPRIDEHSLATRLSYFLWSTTPDDELMELAGRGELRANLDEQLERMIKDRRSEALAENFAGQWLRARDVENFEVDLRFGHDLAEAMQRETEQYFEHVVREDRSVLELIDSNYTFLNERLAEHYGIAGVTGRRFRRVELPEGSPRGGVLTQGTLLVVTSNPTRTSPVKRGLFLLENILGTPPPPPPPDVPPLESAATAITGRDPTVRELQEQHRSDPLCHSCHARMDPLGLALENFTKLGQWRETEHGQPIDASGTLLTGEQFAGIQDLKRVLKGERRLDFYRCLTEKLLTYALGRGLEYYDEHTVDQIVERLDREEGKFSALLAAIVQSAPFQRQRPANAVAARH